MTLRPLIPIAWLVILLTPLLALCVWQAWRAHRDPVRPRPRIGRLTPGGTGIWSLRALAVVALVVIGLGPSVSRPSSQELGVGVDVFFVVDRTGSMAAEDYVDGQTRLDGVRADLAELVADVPGARYSILSWDSAATRQLPLSSDGQAVVSWADTLRQEATAHSSGSNVGRPAALLQDALTTAAEAQPGHVRLVFFLSDGEQTDEEQVASYAGSSSLVDGGAVLGYGSAEGGRMLKDDGSGYIQDTDGQDAVSVIDETALQTVADELGVTYLHRTGPDADQLAGLVGDVQAQSELRAEGRTVMIWNPVVWPAAVAVLLLLLAEAWLLVNGWTSLRRGKRTVPATAGVPGSTAGAVPGEVDPDQAAGGADGGRTGTGGSGSGAAGDGGIPADLVTPDIPTAAVADWAASAPAPPVRPEEGTS